MAERRFFFDPVAVAAGDELAASDRAALRVLGARIGADINALTDCPDVRAIVLRHVSACLAGIAADLGGRVPAAMAEASASMLAETDPPKLN